MQAPKQIYTEKDFNGYRIEIIPNYTGHDSVRYFADISSLTDIRDRWTIKKNISSDDILTVEDAVSIAKDAIDSR